VDGVVVGIDTEEQLRQNLVWFSAPKLTAAEIEQLREDLPVLSEETLNPAKWSPRKHI
jgi:aryl-alcohol dehydrogenase-like predicted oxidoreductase